MTEIFNEQPDFEIRTARDGLEALAMLGEYMPDVITLDVHMPRMDGLSCLDRIMIEHPCPVVMVSSLTAEAADATLEALYLGAVDFIAAGRSYLKENPARSRRCWWKSARGGQRLGPRASRRLTERVRHRVGTAVPRARPRQAAPEHFVGPNRAVDVMTGFGLFLIGVSTGGSPALEVLPAGLPASCPWPIWIAQHMPASFTGPLAKRLDGLCALSVQEVSQSTPLHPGFAYSAHRGDADIIVTRRARGLVALAAPPIESYPWYPVYRPAGQDRDEPCAGQPVDRHSVDRHGPGWRRGDGGDA